MSPPRELIAKQLGPQLSSATTGNETLWFVLPVVRRSDYTHETMLPRYLQGHGPLAAPALLYAGFTDVIQVHLPDISTASIEKLGPQAAELRKLDAIAYFGVKAEAAGRFETFFKHPYVTEVLIPDENGFMHEEIRSEHAERDPPFLDFPIWSLEQWKAWAVQVGGVAHPIISGGEIRVHVPKEIQDKWDKLNGEAA